LTPISFIEEKLFIKVAMEIKELEERQRRIASRIIKKNSFGKLQRIAGVDCSIKKKRGKACAVVLSYPDLKLLEKKIVRGKVNFPYIPGFLSFREGPLMIKALKSLSLKPSVTLVDGNGLLHPRRCGLASWIGVLLKIATIGVAKSLLLGRIKGKLRFGKWVSIMEGKERIGAAVMSSRKARNPIFVSIGNQVSLKTAVEIVFKCCKHRIPEPLRLAHSLSAFS
jgi:deoxyribonuclease V